MRSWLKDNVGFMMPVLVIVMIIFTVTHQLESRLNARIERVEDRLTQRIDRIEDRLETRIDSLESKIDRLQNTLDAQASAG